jgi:hypothetical protein
MSQAALNRSGPISDRLLKEAAEAAASNYVTQIWNGRNDPNFNYRELADRINNDPAFVRAPQMKSALLDQIRPHLGE